MKTHYVGKRSELTMLLDYERLNGNEVYRTRVICECRTSHRDAILVVNPHDTVILCGIRCKKCSMKG